MNIYILKINKKYLNNILKYKININKIVSKDNYYYLYLNTLNYNKIKNIPSGSLIGIECQKRRGKVTLRIID